jgi:hypothetical protein
MYWRQRQTGECVIVRVADGRYQSITSAPALDCAQNDASSAPAAASGDGFDSICGVIVDGRTHRYRCTVSGARPGKGDHKTVLRYPDQTITLEWRQGDSVQVILEGMRPMSARFRTSEGETNFVVEGKTYFYISDRDMAAMEVRHFRE